MIISHKNPIQLRTVKEMAFWNNVWRKGAEPGTMVSNWLGGFEELRGKTVLDVGCGGGSKIAQFASTFKAKSYVGVDISEEALSLMRQNGFKNQSFIQADARSLPFGDNSFDIVIAIASLEFLGRDIVQALSEMRRVSNDKVIFTVPLTKQRYDIFNNLGFGNLINLQAGFEGINFCPEDINPLLNSAKLGEGHVQHAENLIMVEANKNPAQDKQQHGHQSRLRRLHRQP
jgi:SAM-dependent methyltransferase